MFRPRFYRILLSFKLNVKQTFCYKSMNLNFFRRALHAKGATYGRIKLKSSKLCLIFAFPCRQ
jgi:hypothetical protein